MEHSIDFKIFLLYLHELKKTIMKNMKQFLIENGQSIFACALGAGLVSQSLPTALFFGLFWGTGVFIAKQWM